MKNFSDLEQILNIKFNNSDLLREALTHRSFLNETGAGGTRHNERLEFLGDAVLELAVTKFLFNKFPQKAEGELTALRAALVNSNMLFSAADKLKLGRYLRLSKGEAKDSGKGRHFILANAFEALIGAIYVDNGYGAAETFVSEHICSNLPDVLEKKLWRDAKSLFQEKSQEIEGITPTYEVLEESGPDHKKHFVVGVFLENEMIASGEGFSKQEAQMEAAENALIKKGWEELG
jgi:ribonuclease-3